MFELTYRIIPEMEWFDTGYDAAVFLFRAYVPAAADENARTITMKNRVIVARALMALALDNAANMAPPY